jgi:hypothetical protein
VSKLLKLELEVGGGFKLSKMEFLHASSRTSSSTSKNIKQKQKQKTNQKNQKTKNKKENKKQTKRTPLDSQQFPFCKVVLSFKNLIFPTTNVCSSLLLKI